MKNKYALITIVIGKKYYDFWKTFAEPSWRKYADKFGYDIICFTQPLDDSERAKSRSAAWQKCLILKNEEVQKYERVVWLDSDIIINYYYSSCICSCVDEQYIGACNAWEFLDYDYDLIQDRMIKYCTNLKIPYYNIRKKYFEDYGLPAVSEKTIQSGVLVLNPKLHNEILLYIYYNYEDSLPAYWHYEMRPLSYEIIKHNLVQWIDNRFNYVVENHKLYFYYHKMPKNYFQRVLRIIKIKFFAYLKIFGFSFWEEELCNQAYLNGFFIHFAGNMKEMKFLRNLL
jgi:hypothetical protein